VRVLAAWAVHAYTASGALLALLAVQAIFQYRYRDAFTWLAAQVIVDATDGWLARRVAVAEVTPALRGATLDDIVDYVAYVFVPAVFVWRSLIVPAAWTNIVCAAMLLSSAYGFSRADAKTTDHYFTGFPSYWNVVVLYLVLGGFAPEANAVVLLALAALVFVPFRYVYPSRTPVLRGTTLAFSCLWGLAVLAMIWSMPAVPRALYWASFAFPVYYVALSAALSARRRTVGGI
jgi:phosphatidylcholine synthase